jgi:NAD(P)H-hydrate epimerase
MLKILSGSDIKNLDRYTIEKQNITSLKLMDRAVNVFLNWYTSNYSSKKSINIFCGVGNNGGDGLQAACILKEKGYKVEIYIVGDSKRFTKECLYHLKNAKNKKIKIVSITNELQSQISNSDVIIDAIIGSGLSRKLNASTSKLVDYINSSNSTIISIDIPTGIPSDSFIKSNFIKANFTLTFQLPKLSFYMPEYSNYIGKIIVLDIGLEKTFIENAAGIASFIEERDVKNKILSRPNNSHKGNFGHGLIIAGSRGMMGACVLALRASLKSGIGLLTCYTSKKGEIIVQTSVPEVMTIVDNEMDAISSFPPLDPYSVVGIGPGIGTSKITINMLEDFFKNVNIPVVIDADAINIIASNKEILNFIPENSVLTPHPKEFKRLVGEYADSYKRIELQKELSKNIKLIFLSKELIQQ